MEVKLEEYTYEKRLGWKNVDKKPAIKGTHEGEVFEWNTKDGVPVIVPDQWEKDNLALEPLPEHIEGVEIGRRTEPAGEYTIDIP